MLGALHAANSHLDILTPCDPLLSSVRHRLIRIAPPLPISDASPHAVVYRQPPLAYILILLVLPSPVEDATHTFLVTVKDPVVTSNRHTSL